MIIGGNYYMETCRRNRRCMHLGLDDACIVSTVLIKKRDWWLIITWKPIGEYTMHAFKNRRCMHLKIDDACIVSTIWLILWRRGWF